MIITRKTTTREVLNVLNGDQITQLIEALQPYPLEVPLLMMSVGDYLRITGGGEDAMAGLLSEPLAYKAFGRIKQLRKEVEQLTKYLQRYEVVQEPEEVQAQQGVPFPTPAERVLTTCVKYYHLHSTAEAERLPLSDYVMAFKDMASDAIYQRKLAKIQARKAKGNGLKR